MDPAQHTWLSGAGRLAAWAQERSDRFLSPLGQEYPLLCLPAQPGDAAAAWMAADDPQGNLF